jgi:hypothetical protein
MKKIIIVSTRDNTTIYAGSGNSYFKLILSMIDSAEGNDSFFFFNTRKLRVGIYTYEFK